MPTLKDNIVSALSAFKPQDTYSAALSFWQTLGYKSDRQPEPYRYTYEQFNTACGNSLNELKAKPDEWEELNILFQITDEEMKNHFEKASQMNFLELDKPAFQATNMKSYLFAA
ncbi:MAG: hypothetical protein RBS43_06435, partial [Candidatus Cloacimonas sp.]|nr:hypothetical protein [Candidatus Cloacimonas sp.]